MQASCVHGLGRCADQDRGRTTGGSSDVTTGGGLGDREDHKPVHPQVPEDEDQNTPKWDTKSGQEHDKWSHRHHPRTGETGHP